jgi:RecB family exonuclease
VLVDLAALDRLIGLGRVDARGMADLVGTVLAEHLPAGGAGPGGGVRALSVQDARGLDFDAVYVLGLDDGTFPMPRRESVLLPDALRRRANPVAAEVLRERLGRRAEGLPLGALLRTSREGQLEDPFLFFLAASMAERELVLVRPASDARGVPCVPSPYLDEVAACFDAPLPGVEVPAARLVPPPAACAEPRELVARVTLDRWRGDAASAASLRAALALRAPAMRDRLDSIDRRVAMERARRRYFLTPGEAGGPRAQLADVLVGRVGAAPGLDAAVADRVWSASAVERLAACGFKFFAADVLRLGETPDPTADADPREGGLLLHKALEVVLAREDLPDDPARRVAEVRVLLGARRDDLMATLPPKDLAVAAGTWGRVVDAVVEVDALEHERRRTMPPEARRTHAEWPFEMPLGRALGNGYLRLRGRADLVDVVEEPDGTLHVTVTDYKSKRDKTVLARMLDPERDLGVTAFQVPLYLAAAEAAFGMGRTPVLLEGRLVASYAPVGRKDVARSLSRETVDDTLDRVAALARDAAAGRFDVDPRSCDEWCAFRTVCRYVRPPTEEGENG